MRTVIPIDILTIGDEDSYHLFISGAIDDRQCYFLIDTGASHTIFDATQINEIPVDETSMREIESAGINSGDLNCKIGFIKKFELGDLKYEDWTVVLIDLTHVNNVYKKFIDKRVVGLIGSDFLLKHSAIIDYKKRELVLRNIRLRNKKI